MKNYLFFLLAFLPVVMLSQSKTITIDWGATNSKGASLQEKQSKLSQKKSIKTISQEALNSLKLVEEDGVLLYKDSWKSPYFIDEKGISISNIKYGNLTSKERKLIDELEVPQTVKITAHNVQARNEIKTLIVIPAVVKQNGQLKKVLSFKVQYAKDTKKSSFTRMPLSNSVLANGEWFKFKVEKTGVHRISKSFLEDLGMNTGAIDPRNLKVFGHGGQPLSLLSEQNSQFDLPETPIQVIGEEDGSFDNQDFILFYGSNTTGYNIENDSNLNPYADESFYYVTVAGGGNGQRIQTYIEPSPNPTREITTFDDEQFFEQDEFSPGRVGRRWYGNRFEVQNEQTFNFDFPRIANGSTAKVIVRMATVSETGTSAAITINGTSVDPLVFFATTDTKLVDEKDTEVDVAANQNFTIDINYNNTGNPNSKSYLDYIRVLAKSNLVGGTTQFVFKDLLAATQDGIGNYTITDASQITQIWDITNPSFITTKQNQDNSATFSLKSLLGIKKTFIAVNQNDYFTPVQIANKRVANQNIKGNIFKDQGGNFQDVDYLIVTAPFLLQPALRLANHHKNLSGLRVKVVTTDKIYEEFSSGKQDISAIRNLVRYIYENASNDENRIKYLCMFGDGSVDYKDRLEDNVNAVPSFHTLRSTSSVSSFISDDFFGSVDPFEGTIGGVFDAEGNVRNDIDNLDIAVGRIVADEVSLANTLVDKIIAYSAKSSYGNWRNNFMLISDDVDEEYEYEDLEVNLDALGDEIGTEKPTVNVIKIHSDAFQQQSSAGGDRYPDVNKAIIEAVEVGNLVINYFGHGGEDGLAKEFIVTREGVENLNNDGKYPCFVTVTCEFTKFDDPERITAGELAYWNESGGAISLVTTTRSITVTLGVRFNKVLAPQLFGYGDASGINNTPAEALRLSKNLLTSDQLRRVIFYIGDPAMQLAFPKERINLTTLNGKPLAGNKDVLQALSKVSLGGTVTDLNGNLLSDYNGILAAKIFDKNVERQTLGNDGVRDDDGNLLILNFTVLGESIFNGQATVTGGRFNFEFVVPRDIQIPVGNGRVSFYAEKNNALEDNAGVNLDIRVGGLNENAPEDNQGPEIQLFMNDESFVNGGITNDSPNLIAKLQDTNGINTASGIGHDMIAILDGDESNPFVLNDFYQAEVDDFTRGKTTFKFRDLEDGLHTLQFKAWDVYNNSAISEIQFVVAGDDVLKLDRVLNYPNPFVNYTEFWFEHNRPAEPLDVQVQIFTVSGKIVKTINQTVTTIGNRSRDIVWNGLDDFGQKIGKGVYVYKITVKSTLTNKQVEKYEKLVIL